MHRLGETNRADFSSAGSGKKAGRGPERLRGRWCGTPQERLNAAQAGFNSGAANAAQAYALG
jgi:hypothetical protein